MTDECWRDWPSHQFETHDDFVRAVQASGPFATRDVYCLNEQNGPTTVYFRTVALKDQMVPPAFDRSRPLFRLMKLNIDEDSPWVWVHVLPDNTPGAFCTPDEMTAIYERMRGKPWIMDFCRALLQHGKATLYEELPGL